MILHKWNKETEDYEDFDSPAKRVQLFSDDMEMLVDCVECGKEMKYGECYTSKRIHNHIGLGYHVCGDCYKKEIEYDNAKRI